MKLYKEPAPIRGLNVALEIGGQRNVSLWTFPLTEHIELMDFVYIRDRYPMIKPRKKAERFKDKKAKL